MGAFVLVAAAHPDSQRELAARASGEAVLQRDEIAGDQGEQVAGLWMRVVPGDVLLFPLAARLAGISVGQQDRIALLVGDDPHPEARRHVGPVDKIGDAAKALGFALRAEIAARGVEAGNCLLYTSPSPRDRQK